MPGDAWRSPVVPGDATGRWGRHQWQATTRQCGSFGIDSRGNRGDEDDEAARRAESLPRRARWFSHQKRFGRRPQAPPSVLGSAWVRRH